MRKRPPRVSIVIPTHDACWRRGREREFFLAALKSIVMQDYSDFEVIVVCPPDKHPQGFPHPFSARSVPNHGTTVGAARNAGLAASHGSWIAFLDSDDLWFPHKLSSQMRYLHSHHECDMVHSDAIAFRNGNNRFSAARLSETRRPIRGGLAKANICQEGTFILTSSLVMRKTLWEETGPFNESLEMYEDDEFILRASDRGFTVGYVPEPLLLFRIKRTNAGDKIRRAKASIGLTHMTGCG